MNGCPRQNPAYRPTPTFQFALIRTNFGEKSKRVVLRQFGREADWFGHDHAPVRYDQVGMAMGCHGEYVETANEILPALERSVASAKPAVIHAVVDPDANVDPPGNWLWAAARTGKM